MREVDVVRFRPALMIFVGCAGIPMGVTALTWCQAWFVVWWDPHRIVDYAPLVEFTIVVDGLGIAIGAALAITALVLTRGADRAPPTPPQ